MSVMLVCTSTKRYFDILLVIISYDIWYMIYNNTISPLRQFSDVCIAYYKLVLRIIIVEKNCLVGAWMNSFKDKINGWNWAINDEISQVDAKGTNPIQIIIIQN